MESYLKLVVMTVKDLRNLAKQMGVPGTEGSKYIRKDELVKLVADFQGMVVKQEIPKLPVKEVAPVKEIPKLPVKKEVPVKEIPKLPVKESISYSQKTSDEHFVEYQGKKYKILKELGRGTRGVVFLIEKDGKKYALKIINNPDEDIDREHSCMETASKHPNCNKNIMCYYSHEIDTDDHGNPRIKILMEYIHGKTLNSFTHRFMGKSGEKLVVKFIKETFSGLMNMISKGIIHQDMNLNNIMYDKDNDCFKFIDLGGCAILSRQSEESKLYYINYAISALGSVYNDTLSIKDYSEGTRNLIKNIIKTMREIPSNLKEIARLIDSLPD